MKYPYLKKDKGLKFCYPLLDGGINKYLEPMHIADNQLSDCQNVWFKNGMLRSRKGFTLAASAQVDKYESVKKGIKFTDVTVLRSSKSKKIAYFLSGDNISYQNLNIYLVDDEGMLESIGVIHLHRTSSEEYYEFSNVFFVCGKAVTGSGIYAFVTTRCPTYGYDYRIYELSADYSEWNRLQDSDFYTPVVYINGRGNNYNMALEINAAMEDKPTSPEALNMLTGRFKAYYSSDEFSNEFALPYKNIPAGTPIECRVYFNPNSYASWTIPTSSDSAKSTFYSVEITVTCDRKNGIIKFSYETGESYPVPRMKNIRLNNIVVTATCGIKSIEKIVGCKNCTVYNSNVYLYGNSENKNEIFSATFKNPLYFSEKMKTGVGKIYEEVTKMAVQQNKLIAFKENEIYKINVSDSAKNSGIFLVDTEDEFLQNEILSSTPIHLEIGCMYPQTVAICGNKLVWMTLGGRVYTLNTTTYGKENNVYELSLPLNNTPNISQSLMERAGAVCYDGYYILFMDKNAYLLEYKIKNFGISSTFTGLKDTADTISWYIWKFPENYRYSHSCVAAGKLVIGCTSVSNMTMYTCVLGGNKDTIIGKADLVEEYDIEASFRTKQSDMGVAETLKNINEMFIECKNLSDINLIFDAGKNSFNYVLRPSDELTVKRITPRLRATQSLSFKVSSCDEIAFGKTVVCFNEISDVR